MSEEATELYNIHTASYQRTAYQFLYHLAAESCIPSYNHLILGAIRLLALTQFRTIGIAEFYNINRGQSVSHSASDSSTDS